MMKHTEPAEWILFVESLYEDYQDLNLKNTQKIS